MAAAMQVTQNADPARLAAVAGSFLRSRPVEHSVILTNLAQAVAGSGSARPAGLPGDLWWWVDDGADVVAVLMHRPPHGASLSTGPPEAMALLAGALRDERPWLGGVGGPTACTRAFAQVWQATGGPPASIGMRQRILVAETLTPPPAVDGEHRLASVADVPTLRPWGAAFVREATPRSPVHAAVDHVSGRVAAGQLHVWDVGGRPVSMAAVPPPEAEVARVQLVYTPPPLRRKGFGAACVAAVTGQQLAHPGRRCMLYTDSANPTSNALYERLGYRPVGEALDLLFAGG